MRIEEIIAGSYRLYICTKRVPTGNPNEFWMVSLEGVLCINDELSYGCMFVVSVAGAEHTFSSLSSAAWFYDKEEWE